MGITGIFWPSSRRWRRRRRCESFAQGELLASNSGEGAADAAADLAIRPGGYFGGGPASVPISAGHRSDSYRTVFRADVGQFWGTIGMVSDKIGRVSEMARNGVRQRPESG